MLARRGPDRRPRLAAERRRRGGASAPADRAERATRRGACPGGPQATPGAYAPSYGRGGGAGLLGGASLTATAQRTTPGERSGQCSDRRESRPPPEPTAG